MKRYLQIGVDPLYATRNVLAHDPGEVRLAFANIQPDERRVLDEKRSESKVKW